MFFKGNCKKVKTRTELVACVVFHYTTYLTDYLHEADAALNICIYISTYIYAGFHTINSNICPMHRSSTWFECPGTKKKSTTNTVSTFKQILSRNKNGTWKKLLKIEWMVIIVTFLIQKPRNKMQLQTRTRAPSYWSCLRMTCIKDWASWTSCYSE